MIQNNKDFVGLSELSSDNIIEIITEFYTYLLIHLKK